MIAIDDEPELLLGIKYRWAERPRKGDDGRPAKLETVSELEEKLKKLGPQFDQLTVIPYLVHSLEQYLLSKRGILVPIPPQLRKERELLPTPA